MKCNKFLVSIKNRPTKGESIQIAENNIGSYAEKNGLSMGI